MVICGDGDDESDNQREKKKKISYIGKKGSGTHLKGEGLIYTHTHTSFSTLINTIIIILY